VYMSRSASTISGSWVLPKNIDSINNSSIVINRLRNPRIATSYSTGVNTDSGGVCAVVLVDRDFDGTGTDMDVIGFYNSRSHITDFWHRLDVANSSPNELQSDIVYHDSARAFLTTYYDSSASKLVYLSHDFNFTAANKDIWTVINNQYNDANPGPAPLPRLVYNPKEKKGAAVWNSKNGSSNSKALFDSDYNLIYSSLASEKPKTFEINVYPNPAKDYVKVNVALKQNTQVAMQVIDMTGKIVMVENYGNRGGAQTFQLDFSNLKTGLYVLQVRSGSETASYKISIEK
jgi:hypothetical protein